MDENKDVAGIEITDAMIEAGIEAYALYDRWDSASWVVSAVYEAMERERLRATAQTG